MYLRYLPNNNIEYMIFLAFSCIGKSWLETTKEPNRELVFRPKAPLGDRRTPPINPGRKALFFAY